MIEDQKPGPSRWPADAALALGASLVVLAINAATGFETLSDYRGDNDSLLRLVQIHDLIAGQGWFDLHQYRMGPEGGFVMHWSRIVDAPIAAIMLAATALTGSAATGDAVALVLWPTLLMGAALYFILRATRGIAPDALFPAVVIGAVSLRFMGIFDPGAIDHHNVQLVLALATVAFLLETSRSGAAAALAGTTAALMLAVGMETAPYVAVSGIAVAMLFLTGAPHANRTAVGFGTAFALVAAFVFVATVPADGWGVAQCDAFSVMQFALAACAGLGLAAIAMTSAARRGSGTRLAALAILGGAVAAMAMMLFPQCLGDPFAGIDPRLRTDWLDAVTEAQPLWRILVNQPAMAATYYATPALALCIMALRFRRWNAAPRESIVAAFLAAAFLVSIWQVRGAMFSVPFAVLPLAIWVSELRARARGTVPVATTLKMLLAWLLSFSVTWTAAAAGVAGAFGSADAASPSASGGKRNCQRPEDYAALARFPATAVLASSNLGSPILARTHHHVLSGPYHRNDAGNLLALDAFMGTPESSEAIVRSHAITLVAICPGNDESNFLAVRAPDGLMARLLTDDPPAWLRRVDQDAQGPLVLYRVVGG